MTMIKRVAAVILLILIVSLIALVACQPLQPCICPATATPTTETPGSTNTPEIEPTASASAGTAEPTSEPTYTPTPTVTPEPTIEPTATGVPTETPTPTEEIQPTPTPIIQPTVPPDSPNLLKNPGFDGNYAERNFNGMMHAVAPDWEPVYCDTPYLGAPCPAVRRGSGNPMDLMMGRAEFKPSLLNERCVELNEWGTRIGSPPCQQWFLAFRSGIAGIKQTVELPANTATCQVGFQVHSWSTPDANATGTTSSLTSVDMQANSTWFILVGEGESNPLIIGVSNEGVVGLTPGTISSRGFGYDDGIYDPPNEWIDFTFHPNTAIVVIGVVDLRLWPFATNDSYVNHAYLRCSP